MWGKFSIDRPVVLKVTESIHDLELPDNEPEQWASGLGPSWNEFLNL